MRLKITKPTSSNHKDLVAAVGWSASNELFSCGDEKSIQKWDMEGQPLGELCKDLDAYVTDIHWLPCVAGQQPTSSDGFAISCTDGTFRIISKTGREEKKVEAHQGACISLRWNHEGTALVTVGEDGAVKVWSRSGAFRSTLAQTENSVYAVAWGSDSDQVLFCSGKDLIIKPLQPSSKQIQWKAHDAPILKVDWNAINNLIVSGGEDCRYKVWDLFGRLLFQSNPLDYPVTSVAWSPTGELFSVGSFNSLRLCDQNGWMYSKAKTDTGSILNMSWTSDGTEVAGAGGNGSLCFGQLIDRVAETMRIRASLEDSKTIRIQDVLNETVEDLDFRDRVINFSLGYSHLVVATSTQCVIYNTSNWNTPHMFDVSTPVHLLVQSEKNFLMVDNVTGLRLFSYEGRQICNPKFQGLRVDLLNAQSVTLANDILAVIDRSDSKTIRFFDTVSGKPMGDPISHNQEVVELALNKCGASSDRKLVFIDRNRDLYITPVLRPQLFKLGTMCDSAQWNDASNVLAGVIDLKLSVWYYPDIVYVDRELLPLTKFVKDVSDFGKGPKIQSFFGSRVTVRRSDGAAVTSNVSPYPIMLYQHCQANQWAKATRLCRFIKDPTLWACLAAMAVAAKELSTAETAFAAIDEVDKLHYILHIKEIPTEEGRNAELALLRRRPDEAESILLQAGLTFRAIKMNVKLFNFDRALELAVNYKTHVDTVLWYRGQYLESVRQPETNQRFLQYSQQVEVDPEKIRAKMQQEKEKEAARPGARRYLA
eukprot:jgi/Mesvir1/15773/Mv03342-RA.1